MARPSLAIVIGSGKLKGKSPPMADDTEETDKPMADDYAKEAWEAAKDDDKEAFDAALEGYARCCAEDDEADDDTEE